MDPILDSDWLGCKNEPLDETQHVGNIARSWQSRELGINPGLGQGQPNKTVLENIAEDILVQKPLKIRCCDLPGYPRSTFLMVFSPDGTKVASTHGNHNVYVSELASGKHVRILKGHPRTPWCIAFHPSHPQLIGSGCLGGQVRVWDLSGGSEVWTVRNETVIASIAFHPRDQLLVIATYNELYFWDWSQPAPFTKVSTNNFTEKVRYVAFDSLGYKLITGISVSSNTASGSSVLQNVPQNNPSTQSASRRDPPAENATNRTDRTDRADSSDRQQDMIVYSYQNLVQRYDSLVRNYQRLFMARYQLGNTTAANTTDRGTDPMETDTSVRAAPPPPPPAASRDSPPGEDGPDTDDAEPGGRLLNLDVLTLNGHTLRSEDPNPNSVYRSVFGSRSSAFQRFHDSVERLGASEPSERSRWLPNPFSASTAARGERPEPEPEPGRRRPPDGEAGSSRTSAFTSQRQDSSARYYLQRMDSPSARYFLQRLDGAGPSRPVARPATANSSTQMSPNAAHNINHSLDLIRDILRDSGTRLLNLINEMSLAALARVERTLPARRGSGSAPAREDRRRPRLALLDAALDPRLRLDDSDSDTDRSLEVDLASNGARQTRDEPAERLDVQLDAGGTSDAPSPTERFRVRSLSGEGRRDDPARPSTSRDEPPPRPAAALPPDEAYRRVKLGVRALHRHAMRLTDMWLDGTRTDMRELRIMWEDLRRRVLSMQRQTGRQDVPSYYARGLLERCRLLADMSRSLHLSGQSRRPAAPSASDAPAEGEPGAAPTRARLLSQLKSLYKMRNSLNIANRRRLQSSYRGRLDDELRRRLRSSSRGQAAGRWSARTAGRTGRRDVTRSFELFCTRHEIRMRAMQVLSAMFDMIMNCLQERGLSQLIVQMLRSLKRALALTCVMLVTNRQSRRESENANQNGDGAPTESRERPAYRLRRSRSNLDLSAGAPDDTNDDHSTSSLPSSDSEDEKKDRKKSTDDFMSKPSTSSANQNETAVDRTRQENPPDRWSDRLAVQISAANRNTSVTARSRRDLYLESKRQRALHRTNPIVHPICKRKVLPPAANYRIPAVRTRPVLRQTPVSGSTRSDAPPVDCPRVDPPPATSMPAANPPGAEPPAANPPAANPLAADQPDADRPPLAEEGDNEFEHRVNLFRMAHMHAIRLRTAARARLRRMHTIRLVAPYAVHDMLAMSGVAGERRPHVLSARTEPARDAPPFDSILNRVAVPLVQDDAPAAEGGAPPAGRLPRVNEYLQPIILAQNALLVEDGGMGGALLDAGLMSEALPALTHRVQAWDFSGGATPDIADGHKNVVVGRCRIHNDASIDISKDGRLLVALLPVPRLRNTNHWLGVYSLEWGRLGQCLHTAALEQSAVSVALSPTARHLAVGLGSRRFTTLPHARNNVFALLYRLETLETSSRTGMSPIKELEQNWEQGFTSLNCLRWAPQPGQGLVYANNTGQLIIMS